MKDKITKDELFKGIRAFADSQHIFFWDDDFINRMADHIMPEFKPEVGKLYAFWDELTDSPCISCFRGMLDGGYQSKGGMVWKHCRPLTEDEVGK